jgi:predicted metal-binding protein
MKDSLHIDTPSAKNLYILANIETVQVDCVAEYEDYNKFEKLCKDGCPNYGLKWSCPPYSPKFNEYSDGFTYITICALKMNLEQLSYIKNDYLKVKAANTILKSKVDKVFGSFVTESTKYVSTGSCRLCRPCKCKKGESCGHSSKMAYSFEALGINVAKITEALFDFELLWYKKGKCPQFTAVIVGLLTNERPSLEKILRTLQNSC